MRGKVKVICPTRQAMRPRQTGTTGGWRMRAMQRLPVVRLRMARVERSIVAGLVDIPSNVCHSDELSAAPSAWVGRARTQRHRSDRIKVPAELELQRGAAVLIRWT